jgi:hypothetical protein
MRIVVVKSHKNPYQEVWSTGSRVRTFFESVDDDELVWHRDRKDRHVFVRESNGWYIQFDDELPFLLEKGKTYFIEAMRYHRVIKGKGNLVIEIRED